MLRRPRSLPIAFGTEIKVRVLLTLVLRARQALYANDTREAIARALGLTVAVERCAVADYRVDQDWIDLVLDIDARLNLPSLVQRVKIRSAAHTWAAVPQRLARLGLKEGELWRPGYRVVSLCAPRPVAKMTSVMQCDCAGK